MPGKTLMPYTSSINGGSYNPSSLSGSLMTGYSGPYEAAPGTTPGEFDPSTGKYIPPSPVINP
jgi:hypothetical protein